MKGNSKKFIDDNPVLECDEFKTRKEKGKIEGNASDLVGPLSLWLLLRDALKVSSCQPLNDG